MSNDQKLQEFKPDRQIEVTDQMVEAGLRIFRQWLPDDAPRSADEGALVAGIFCAMFQQLPSLPRT